MKVVLFRIITGLLIVTVLVSFAPVINIQANGTNDRFSEIIFEECTYKSGKTKYEALCGDLQVPENRNDPESRLITLPVIKVPSTGNNPQSQPILWLEGGPGQSNLKFLIQPWMVENHDILMIGYRGADGETRMDCPEVEKALGQDQYFGLSTEAMQMAREGLDACSTRLINEGFDLEAYSIEETIADMEDARMAMGYETVNLFSISYGTRLAQLYAQNYPEQIHRNLMVSVNPPGNFIWYPERIDAQFAQYAALCAQDEYCSSRTADLIESMQTALNNLPDRWLFIKIDPDKVKMGSFAMLFQRTTAASVFDAYLVAEQGDYSGMALLSLAADMMIPKLGIWGHFYAMGGIDDRDGFDYQANLNPDDAWFGSPIAAQIWIPSDGWKIYPASENYRTLKQTDVETLVVSGNIDFSTPAENATEQLMPYLENGHQVSLSELGHAGDVILTEADAFANLGTRFYTEGVVDESMFTYQPMTFKTGVRFPLFAKLLIIIPVVLLILIVLLVNWLVRRRKRRKQA